MTAQVQQHKSCHLTFPHEVGFHCSSTAIRACLRHDGHDLSEPMVFGLAAGLGFSYFCVNGFSPSRLLGCRALDVERKFYRRMEAPLEYVGRFDPEAMLTALQAGRPLLARTNLMHLPYYEPAFFPGHALVITGLDLEANQVMVADVISPQEQVISLEVLERAMGEASPPGMDAYDWAPAPLVQQPLVTPHRLAGAIKEAMLEMMEPPFPGMGLEAMDHLSRDFSTWAKVSDWVWCARFAYQCIEKRGTGGAGFRAAYADFLEEAQQVIPELATLEAAQRCRAIAQGWHDLAACLKEIFVMENPQGFQQAAGLMEAITHDERALCHALHDLATRLVDVPQLLP